MQSLYPGHGARARHAFFSLRLRPWSATLSANMCSSGYSHPNGAGMPSLNLACVTSFSFIPVLKLPTFSMLVHTTLDAPGEEGGASRVEGEEHDQGGETSKAAAGNGPQRAGGAPRCAGL